MKKYLILLFAIPLLWCCKQNSSEKLVRKHISEIENQIKADSTRGEDFTSFFEQFKRDTLFQQERVTLPFTKLLTCEDGYGGRMDSTILISNRKDWVFFPFLMNNSTNYPFQNITIQHDTALVFLGDNQSADYSSNSIHAQFVRAKGKWTGCSLEIVF